MNSNKVLKLQSYDISLTSANMAISNVSWMFCSSFTFMC